MEDRCRSPGVAFLRKAMWDCESCASRNECRYKTLSLAEVLEEPEEEDVVEVKDAEISATEKVRQILADLRDEWKPIAFWTLIATGIYCFLKTLFTPGEGLSTKDGMFLSFAIAAFCQTQPGKT